MDLLSRPVLRADHRIFYGADPSQIGDLWLPDALEGTCHPTVIFFHGGWWKSEYDLGYAGHLCHALKREGIATWSVEYRRIGETGGGWPATFHDAALGFDHASTLAKSYPLNLSRAVVMGHSAGAHLAFWNAGRHHLPPDSEIHAPMPAFSLRGAISLAGAVDLLLAVELSGQGVFAHDKDEVYRLMGGGPHDLPRRYGAGNPGQLLPFEAPQALLQGTDDDQIPPELPLRWAEMSKRLGSHATVTMIPHADHFDVVDPESHAWPTVLAEIKRLLSGSLER